MGTVLATCWLLIVEENGQNPQISATSVYSLVTLVRFLHLVALLFASGGCSLCLLLVFAHLFSPSVGVVTLWLLCPFGLVVLFPFGGVVVSSLVGGVVVPPLLAWLFCGSPF